MDFVLAAVFELLNYINIFIFTIGVSELLCGMKYELTLAVCACVFMITSMIGSQVADDDEDDVMLEF